MKSEKSIVIILMLLFFIACSSSPKADKPKAAISGFHAEYTDWQGAAFGAEIPEWVAAVTSAGSEEELRKLLGKPKNYRVWAVMARGENLDALKILTDNFDIQSQVGASISQNIAEIAERVQQTEGTTEKAKIEEQTAKVVNMVNMNLTLNGLERVTSYWTKYYMADKKGNPAPGDSGNELYAYIVVMGMEGDRFEAQLDEAMKKIKDNTSEDDYLRKLSDVVIADLKKTELLSASINADLNIANAVNSSEPSVSSEKSETPKAANNSAGEWELHKIRNDIESCTVYTFSYISPESCRIIVGLKLADNPLLSRAYCGISDLRGLVVVNGSNGESVQRNYSTSDYSGYDYWYLNGSNGDYYRCNKLEGRDTTRWLFDLCLANDTLTFKTGNGDKTATFKTAGLQKALENTGLTVRDITDAFANGKY